MSRLLDAVLSSGDELGEGLHDLGEFAGTLPRTFSDQEVTVINDPSQLSFLSNGSYGDAVSLGGGYTSEEEEEEVVDWDPSSMHSRSQPRMPVSGPALGAMAHAAGAYPHQNQHQFQQQQLLMQQQHLGHGGHSHGGVAALTLGQVLQPQLGVSGSPSKRMKRRLSNPRGLANPASAGQGKQPVSANKGMLRASSVPHMRSAAPNTGSGGSPTSLAGASPLPPLKETGKASRGKAKSSPKAAGASAAATAKGKAASRKKSDNANRRHRHNESERVRMRTIAAKIAEMKELMEATGIVVPKEKAKILTGAVEYIKHLKKVAQQKSVQLTRVQEGSTFNASPLPCCVMDAACNFIDSNRHFTRHFGQPHKAFPTAILLVPDWIYGRSVPQKVGLWLDLVQSLRNDHSRIEGIQLEDQCVRHDGKAVNFRIVASLINFHPSATHKDIRILLTFFPLPAQAPVAAQLLSIKNPDALRQQTTVAPGEHSNQLSSSRTSTGGSEKLESFGK